VPGIDGLIKSAPSASSGGGGSGLSGLESSLPRGLGGAASVAEWFQKLGLSPQMAEKSVPVLTKFCPNQGRRQYRFAAGGRVEATPVSKDHNPANEAGDATVLSILRGRGAFHEG
jgi:hypothetical protein